MALKGLEGLSAEDRAAWEKKYSSQIQGQDAEWVDRFYKNIQFKEKFGNREDYNELIKMSAAERDAYYEASLQESDYATDILLDEEELEDSVSVQNSLPSDVIYTDTYNEVEKELDLNSNIEDYMEKSAVYQMALAKNKGEYDEYTFLKDKATKNIRTRAEEISSYYKKYKDTEYLPFTDADWANMAAEYNAKSQAFGEDEANNWLRWQIQNTASENQGVLEKYWRGFTGMGASAAGALVSTAGMLYGLEEYIAGDYEDVEGLSTFGNIINAMMDNSVTRYGNDITKWGSLSIAKQREAEELGISNLEIIQKESDVTGTLAQQIFNINTLPVAIQQGGFTVASMATGWGAAKLAGLMFKGAKIASMAGKAGNTTQKLLQARKALETVQKAENFTNKFIIPGVVGTTEGVVNGLNTKLETYEEATRLMTNTHMEAVNNLFQELSAKYKDIDPNILYKQAWDAYAPQYEESLKQIEFAASKAGINDFLVNSAVNGLVHSTFKAGLMHPNVQGALKESKMFGWAFPKGSFNVTGTGANVSVSPKYGIGKQIFNIAKEPLGEFSEEYLQSISSATMQAGASNNIHQFIENKYNGDGSAQVGDQMAGDFAAAFSAMGDAFTSKESIKSGILGAISQSIGTPTFRARDYTKRVKNADGTYSTEIDFSRREGESRFEHITRLAPWRSGLVDAIRENNQTKRQLYDEAATLETWLRDPNNRAKFDGIVGTFSWAKQMGEAGASSDEFGYRNSLLGKTINDAFMLEKLRGTAYYDSFMKEVIQAANLEEGSQEAQKFIQALRENVHSNNENISDHDLITQVKANANNLLTTLDKINEHSDKIDRVLGNVDEDTKQALIYGEMSLRDWEGRSESLRTELDNISSTISTSREHSTADSNIKPLINRYGSITQAKKVKGQLSDTKRGLIEDIKTLESRQKNLTKTEKNILKEKKARLKAINQELSYLKDAEKLEDTADVLNEQEIMALPPLERARFLNKKNLSSFSQEQQAVITNLINEGTSKDIDFYSKVQDAGKIELAAKTFLTQYNSILQDPQSFNAYVQRAKQAASDVLTKKRYEEVVNIQDYKTFSTSLDKLIDGSSAREQRMIIRALENSKSPNYLKYKENRKAIEGLVKQVLEDGTINLDENDASLFAQTLTYLSNNDVNFNDADAVVAALSSIGSNGKTNFENYVDELNESIPELERTVFTSTGEVIQNFKDVLEKYNKDNAEVENNEKGVIVEPVTTNDNRPAPEVNATVNPGIFATASKSLEEAEADMKRSQDNNTSETRDTKEDSNIEKLKENNSEEIITAYNTAVNTINNDKYSSKEVKAIALESLNNLVVGEYESTDEFAEAIIREANKLDVFGDKHTEDAAKVLRSASTIIKNAANKKKEEIKEEPKKPVTDVRPVMERNPNAAIAESLDIQYMKNQHPESPIVAFLEKHNVESFLQLNPLPKGTKVLFYVDEELTNSVRTSMGDTYTDNSLPLVAVVEHEKGTIDINGKKYQPIGVFPRTDNSNFNGSTRVGKVREFIGDTKTGLISKNGTPLEGTLNRVVAEKIEHLDKSIPNNNVVNLAEEALTIEDRNALNSIPKAFRKGHYAYRKAKDFFLKHLSYKSSTLKSGNTSPKAYYFNIDNLKGDNFDVEVFVTPVSKTISTKSNKSVVELFNEDNVAESLQANSRLERSSEILRNAFKGIPSSEDMTLASNEGKIEAVGDTKEALSNIEKAVSKNVNNQLFTGQSWNMSLTPSEKLTDDGDRIFTLSLVHTNGEEIQLGEVHRGELSDDEVFNILKNLITDNGNIRTYDGKELVKWQVEYTEDPKALENNGNVGRAYDDGILEVSVASLVYTVHKVEVNSPFNSNGEIINTGGVITPTVANSDNASTNEVTNTPTVAPNNVVVTGSAIIDSDTGTVLQGEEPKVEKPVITEEVKAESAENNVDPYTGLPIGEVRDRSRRRERRGNSTNLPKYRILPSRLSWGKWENLELENAEDLDLPYKEIDLEKEAKWLRKVLPQLSKNDRLVIAKGLINAGTKGLKAWGKFSDGIITLSDVAAEGTLYHEAFHAVFNLMLDSSERQALLAEARQMYGNKSDLTLEEDLAEGFREYVMSRDTNNLLDKIKNFFKDLWIKVTNWNKIQHHLDAYYKRINEGYYGNKELGNFEGTRNRFIGEIGARNLDRENNSITIGYNLITARSMDENGKDPSIIKSITGWEKGIDGKWRYERMDQSKSVNIDLLLEGKQFYNLADLYQDKELYKEYPSLQYYTVEIVESDKKGGYLDFDNRVIALEKGNFEEYSTLVKSGQISKDSYAYVKEVTKIKIAKTLVHEIQHAIQTIENFAPGGSPESVLPEDKVKLKELYRQYSDAIDTYNNLSYQEQLTPYGIHLKDEILRLENEYLTVHDNTKIGLEGYMRLAGEVESRNVEYRLDTDYKQRPPLRNLAKFTEDVDRESQIVLLAENTPWKATESVRYRLANGLSTIESEQIRRALEDKNYTEEVWNDLTPKEMEHELKCLGVNI